MNSDLKAQFTAYMRRSVEGAEGCFERLRVVANAPRTFMDQARTGFDNILLRANAELDLFCAKHVNAKESSGSQVVNIGNFVGVLGQVSNSLVSVYDYSSVQQLLGAHKIPKQDRRELEDIM